MPGIGRKSANVIKREAGAEAEGVIVDLHVVRVAPRLGIATGADPKKIEKQIIDIIPQKDWEVGMWPCRFLEERFAALSLNAICV